MKFKKTLINLFNSDPTFIEAIGPSLLKELTSPRPKPEAILNILVVEDNPVDQASIVAQLKNLGLEASSVSNGREAIEALSFFAYDLILMDCQMPQLNGYQALEAIRKGEAGIWGSKTPVIAITGAVENLKKCVVAGMDDCLLKPLDIAQLKTSIQKFLKKDQNMDPHKSIHQDQYDSISPTNISRIDSKAINQLKGLQVPGEPDVLAELVQIFITTTPKYLAGMRVALENKDLSLLSQGAHTIKSSSASLGANWLREIAFKIEMINSSDSLGEAKRLMDRLEIEFQYAKTELQHIAQAGQEARAA